MLMNDDEVVSEFVGKELAGFSIFAPSWEEPANGLVLEFLDGTILIVKCVGDSDGVYHLDIDKSKDPGVDE